MHLPATDCVFFTHQPHRVQVLDIANGGSFVAEYGSSSGLRLKSPYGIAVDDAHAYISERDAHKITVSGSSVGES